MVVRRILATAAAVPLLLLAACNGDEPTPQMPTPTASSSTASTPTPTVDPLAIPDEAKEPTKAGAEALIRHYYDMFNHLWASGDSAPVRKLFGDRCDLCEIPVGVVELAQSKGHTYEGSQRISGLRLPFFTGRDVPSALVLVDIAQTEVIERNAGGKVVNRFPADEHEAFEYNLAFQGGSWEILNGEVAQ